MESLLDTRPSWDEYFLRLANDVSMRSNCSRRKVGAVIVKDNHILSTGYNGTPMRTLNCFEGGCPRCSGKAPSGTSLDECQCVHAEQNAICQAAMYGTPIKDSTIYVSIWPCLTCSKLIVNAGIKKVVYGGNYTQDLEKVEKLLSEADVDLKRFDLVKEQRDRFTKSVVENLRIKRLPDECEFVLEEPERRDCGMVSGFVVFDNREMNALTVGKWLEAHGFVPNVPSVLQNGKTEIRFFAVDISAIRGDC